LQTIILCFFFFFLLLFHVHRIDRAVAALEFLDVANKAHPGKRIVCPQSSRLQEWLSGWRLRPGTELLKASTCTELDLVKRFRELEFRSSNFLEINQQILPQGEKVLVVVVH
jgi:hypothetical protein